MIDVYCLIIWSFDYILVIISSDTLYVLEKWSSLKSLHVWSMKMQNTTMSYTWSIYTAYYTLRFRPFTDHLPRYFICLRKMAIDEIYVYLANLKMEIQYIW